MPYPLGHGGAVMESPESIIKVQFKTKVKFILVKTLVKKSFENKKWEYLILPTYSSLQSVAYTQVAYRRLPIDSSLLLSLEIFWPIPSMPEARL